MVESTGSKVLRALVDVLLIAGTILVAFIAAIIGLAKKS